MDRLGVVLSTATEAPPKEFVELGKFAEDKGYAAIFVNEGRGDGRQEAIVASATKGQKKKKGYKAL